MRHALCLVLVIAGLALVVGKALPDRGGVTVSDTREFSIDGRIFRVEDPAGDDFSLIARELSKLGIDTQPLSENLLSVLASGSVESLREEKAIKGAPALPRGLEPDHFLRLETGTGPIEIAFGRVVCGENNFLARLRSSGWECRDTDAQGTPGAVAQLTKRKETSFVLLEKNEGRFLAIRRSVR